MNEPLEKRKENKEADRLNKRRWFLLPVYVPGMDIYETVREHDKASKYDENRVD